MKMKTISTILVAITILFPLHTNAKGMTEKDFIQSMYEYTSQQNDLTQKISVQARNKNIPQGAKLTCQLDKINTKKNKILQENPQYKKLLNPQFITHNESIIKQTKETLSYTTRSGYPCSKFRL